MVQLVVVRMAQAMAAVGVDSPNASLGGTIQQPPRPVRELPISSDAFHNCPAARRVAHAQAQ